MTHRKLFFGIVALAILLSVQTGTAQAESFGSAIVPHYELYFKDGAIHGGHTIYIYPYFFISNVSEATVTVKVSFYDSHGQLILGTDNDPLSGPIQLGKSQTNYSELSSADCTASFDLDPKESEKIRIAPHTYFSPSTNDIDHGFAKIAWSSTTGIVSPPLVATYEKYKSYTYQGVSNFVAATFTINNGMPF